MNIKLLSQKYAEEDLDLEKAIQVWKEARLAPENIREQVQNDVGIRISAIDAKTLYKLGETKQTALKEYGMAEGDEKNCPFYAINYSNQNKNYDGMEVIAKDYTVSEGRSDLIPFNLQNGKKIKLTPNIRKAFDRVGENLFRDKIAAKYWTLKEKIGEDGKKSVYLVAIETPDSQVKHASIKEADVYVDPDQATETPEARESRLRREQQPGGAELEVQKSIEPGYYQQQGQVPAQQTPGQKLPENRGKNPLLPGQSLRDYSNMKTHGLIPDYGREIKAQGTPSTTAPTNEQSNAEVSPQGTKLEEKEEHKPAIEEGF